MPATAVMANLAWTSSAWTYLHMKSSTESAASMFGHLYYAISNCVPSLEEGEQLLKYPQPQF